MLQIAVATLVVMVTVPCTGLFVYASLRDLRGGKNGRSKISVARPKTVLALSTVATLAPIAAAVLLLASQM